MSRSGQSEGRESWILGTWYLLRADATVELQPGTRMQFGSGDLLQYTIPTPAGELCALLRWRLDGDILHTHLEDGGNPAQVGATLGEADVMMLDFGGPRAWFVREG